MSSSPRRFCPCRKRHSISTAPEMNFFSGSRTKVKVQLAGSVRSPCAQARMFPLISSLATFDIMTYRTCRWWPHPRDML